MSRPETSRRWWRWPAAVAGGVLMIGGLYQATGSSGSSPVRRHHAAHPAGSTSQRPHPRSPAAHHAAAAGTRAWAAAVPAAFQAATGLTPPAAFWIVPVPFRPGAWWALDPTATDNQFQAGIWLAGRWWWGTYDLVTGTITWPDPAAEARWGRAVAQGASPAYATDPPGQRANLTWYSLVLALQAAAALWHGQRMPAGNPLNQTLHPWNLVAGHVGPPFAWSATTAGGATTLTVWCVDLAAPAVVDGVTVEWVPGAAQPDTAPVASIVTAPNQAATWTPSQS